MERFLVAASSQPCQKETEPSSPAPSAPQQEVVETSTTTPTGHNIRVSLERVSEGGTRHTAHFSRAAPASQAMTAAERGRKKRAVTSLYPGKQAAQQAARRAYDSTKREEREGSAMAQEGEEAEPMRQPAIELSDEEEEPLPSRPEPPHPSRQDPCYYCLRLGSERCDRCPWGERRDLVNRVAEWLCLREVPGTEPGAEGSLSQCTMKELLSALQAEDRWFIAKMRDFRTICRPYRYHVQMDWLRTYLDVDRFMLVDRQVHLL